MGWWRGEVLEGEERPETIVDEANEDVVEDVIRV